MQRQVCADGVLYNGHGGFGGGGVEKEDQWRKWKNSEVSDCENESEDQKNEISSKSEDRQKEMKSEDWNSTDYGRIMLF